MIILSELPINHHLRNTPLIEIGAEYQCKGSKMWHSVKVLGGIKKHITYNHLGEVWTKFDIWRVNNAS